MTLKQLGIAILIGLGGAAGFFAAQSYERAQRATERDAITAQAADNLAALRADAERWATSIALGQGEMALRSFVAGLTPLLLAERTTALDIAGASLLRLHGVQGVSIVRADGKALYASDAKLLVSDDGNEQTRWALAATDFSSRDSVQPGVKEMSLPVNDAGKLLAVVWLAYDAAAIREQARPALFQEAAAATTGNEAVEQ